MLLLIGDVEGIVGSQISVSVPSFVFRVAGKLKGDRSSDRDLNCVKSDECGISKHVETWTL